ncbi:hypothetical protein K431DRAFT_323048 [Polychaeton citri CBS 116435]|uniref:Metallothionein-I gene transcription activator n=1 Tax=Polychaeton citri CBS 116435 TaxID=1314669 RepID=A0A9P4PYY6_9PEZI|nr:hypothetical protein K431DRAFT_323048 [Polychaeton citri CBS 116435]
MSREQYTPPNLSGGSSGQTNPGQGNSYGAFQITGQSAIDDSSRPVHYLCGECDARISLKKGEAIRCKECGYRVLYKERTNRMIQFEAR